MTLYETLMAYAIFLELAVLFGIKLAKIRGR
jgi:hypothetical protein